MYLVPLWSGLMVNHPESDSTEKINRKDNNISEINFKINKHTVLDHLKNMPVTIATHFLLRIGSQSILYDIPSVSFLSEITHISMMNDVWFDKKKTKNSKQNKPYYAKTDLNKLKGKKGEKAK